MIFRGAAVGEGAGVLVALERVLADVSGVVAGAEGAPSWSGAVRQEVLSRVDRVVDLLAVARGAVQVAERDALTWRGSGDASFEAWRGRSSRAGTPAAVAQTRQGEVLASMPELREAVTAGQVAGAHVEVLARVAAGASPEVARALSSEQGREQVLGLARRQDAGTFARSMRRWVAQVDPGQVEREHAEQHAARYVQLHETGAGTTLSGLLDRVAGRTLRHALEALTPRPGIEDTRTGDQRRADALTQLAQAALTDPGTTPGAAVRPHLSLLVSESTWTAIRHRRLQSSTGAGRDATSDAGRTVTRGQDATTDPTSSAALTGAVGLAGIEPVTFEDGAPVPLSVFEQLACDCEITRIVIDATGEPLDLGRTARLYTGTQRRAVIARDRTCVWNGCTMPARWCEIHHLDWWHRDGGTTSVRRGVLGCTHHHQLIHRLNLTLTRLPATDPRTHGALGALYTFTDPTGRIVNAPDALDAPSAAPEDGHAVAPATRSEPATPAASRPGAPGAPGRPAARSRPPTPPGSPPGSSPWPSPGSTSRPASRPPPATRRPAPEDEHATPFDQAG